MEYGCNTAEPLRSVWSQDGVCMESGRRVVVEIGDKSCFADCSNLVKDNRGKSKSRP